MYNYERNSGQMDKHGILNNINRDQDLRINHFSFYQINNYLFKKFINIFNLI